jgi:hypothetical protein
MKRGSRLITDCTYGAAPKAVMLSDSSNFGNQSYTRHPLLITASFTPRESHHAFMRLNSARANRC